MAFTSNTRAYPLEVGARPRLRVFQRKQTFISTAFAQAPREDATNFVEAVILVPAARRSHRPRAQGATKRSMLR